MNNHLIYLAFICFLLVSSCLSEKKNFDDIYKVTYKNILNSQITKDYIKLVENSNTFDEIGVSDSLINSNFSILEEKLKTDNKLAKFNLKDNKSVYRFIENLQKCSSLDSSYYLDKNIELFKMVKNKEKGFKVFFSKPCEGIIYGVLLHDNGKNVFWEDGHLDYFGELVEFLFIYDSGLNLEQSYSGVVSYH